MTLNAEIYMDFNELYNIIIGNPIYTLIAALLIILLIYSLIKKFVKILIIVLVLIAGYISVLYFQGDEQTVKDVDKMFEEVDKAIKPVKDVSKDAIEQAKEKLKNNSNK